MAETTDRGEAAPMSEAIEARRERVRAAVAASGKSVNAVAEDAGMKEPSLRGFLNGKTRDMRIESYEALAPVLNCSPEFLIFGWNREVVPDFDVLRDVIVAVLELTTGGTVVGDARDITALAIQAYQLALEDREPPTAAGTRLAVKALALTRTSPRDGS